jgi:hypothetical protein
VLVKEWRHYATRILVNFYDLMIKMYYMMVYSSTITVPQMWSFGAPICGLAIHEAESARATREFVVADRPTILT